MVTSFYHFEGLSKSQFIFFFEPLPLQFLYVAQSKDQVSFFKYILLIYMFSTYIVLGSKIGWFLTQLSIAQDSSSFSGSLRLLSISPGIFGCHTFPWFWPYLWRSSKSNNSNSKNHSKLIPPAIVHFSCANHSLSSIALTICMLFFYSSEHSGSCFQYFVYSSSLLLMGGWVLGGLHKQHY